MSKILIADSGSTKTEWCLVNGKKNKTFLTNGINPYFVNNDEGMEMLERELKMEDLSEIKHIYFYSAGVKAPKNQKAVKELLKNYFSNNNVDVETDMLGAARAACGSEKGVTSILGTGSNSCYFDGTKIAKQHPSLGFIIGDEGSGSQMGKKVLQHFFYGTFEDELMVAFETKYGAHLPDFLERIYKQPMPNRFLASFVDFLKEHRGHFMVENIIEDSLLDFFEKSILKYRETWKYPLHFVGSIAFEFKDVLQSIMDQFGLECGRIHKSPIDGLISFHRNN